METIENKPIKKLRGKEAVYSSGDKYGYLTLTGKSEMRKKSRYVEAICECGKIWFTAFKDVSAGRTKSCGCKRMEFIIKGNTKHGLCYNGKSHPIYRAYLNMKSRCRGLGRDNYKNYTLRGITVCKEWVDDFDTFYKWATTNGWQEGLMLDRINNDKGYSAENCRWATDAISTRNTRQNVFVEAFGERKCLQDWALDSRCHISFNTLRYRLKFLKWDAEKAITTKPKGEYRSDAVILEYNGEQRGLIEWCKILGLKEKVVRDRIQKGWEIIETLETKVRRRSPLKTKV